MTDNVFKGIPEGSLWNSERFVKISSYLSLECGQPDACPGVLCRELLLPGPGCGAGWDVTFSPNLLSMVGP